MKKLIAISLLLIHLFNLAGQLALHQYLVYQSDKLINEQVGKNRYRIDDLTEVKIPANMPTVTSWKYYQKLAGIVQFKNTAYNYVKIKITESAIYLLCVPNYEKTHLCDQNIINAGHIPDIPVPKKDHVPFGKLNLVTYSYQDFQYWFSVPIIEIDQVTNSNRYFVVNSSINKPGQPPDQYVVIS